MEGEADSVGAGPVYRACVPSVPWICKSYECWMGFFGDLLLMEKRTGQ